MNSIKKIGHTAPRMLMAKCGNLQPETTQSVEVTRVRVNPDSVARFIRKYQRTAENFNTATPEGCGQKLKTQV